MPPAADRRIRVALALAAVYFVWGSSYVATKVLVTVEPPLVAAGWRFLLAAGILATIAAWRGERPPRSALEWRTITLCALTNVVASNGFNAVGIQHVPSNVAALLNATPALWIAWLGTFGPRGVPLTGPTRAGLVIGLAGVLLVLLPNGGSLAASLPSQLLILLGCLGWSVGTIIYRNAAPKTPPMMFTALQMVVGGVLLLVGAPLIGEPVHFVMSLRGVAPLLWLTIMSSCVGYTAYAWLVNHTTPVVVGSYAYVNPAIAALVGWAVLGETLAIMQIAGMVVIFAAVALVMGYLAPFVSRSAQPPAGEP